MKTKCHFDEKGSLVFCEHMEEETRKANTGNGTVFQHIYIPESGEAMLLHNKGEGQVLNFCPFCGGRIAPLVPISLEAPNESPEAYNDGTQTF